MRKNGIVNKYEYVKEKITMDNKEKALLCHKEWNGKLETVAKSKVKTREDLAIAYTPGVAEPCKVIAEDKTAAYTYTWKANTVAVVSDGSAVLGLGNIGAYAAMPVMEGKCVLFKSFGGVDAFPLCIRSKDVDEIVNTITLISGSFGGINLEDISAPRCFEIEKKLKERCDIPVFHDDQHGTAVVTLAGLINALILVKKRAEDIRVTVNGAGAAAIAITKLLFRYGVGDIILCDRAGAIYKGRAENMNPVKEEIAEITNHSGKRGKLEDVIKQADVFIGVSAPDVLTKEMAETMAENAVVFACANPVPEINPETAKAAGVRVVATGRSDYPNQINNVLAFPGIFRGVFDVHAREINDEMKIAAAEAIAGLIPESGLREDYVIPAAFDERVGKTVAAAVAEAARKSGVIKE